MNKIIFTALLMLWASTCQAKGNIYRYSLNKEKKLHGVIAEGVASRLEFGLVGFREIIGDQSKYTFITDHNNKSIFLTPKVPAGESIAISLVNQSGEVIDLDLSVKKIEGQVIKIDKDSLSFGSGSYNEVSEIKSMIKAMQKDIDYKGKYYVLSEPRDILSNIEGISMMQDRTYQYGNIIGSRILVKNLSKHIRELQKADFKNLFENSLAISFQKKVLKSKDKGFVYIVAKEKSDD